MPPLSTDYVFISYSRRDDAVMRRVVAFLREQGIKVWVDNEKLIPGTPVWEKEIEKAVQGASAVVVVLSPDSKDSEWVRREISLVDQYEKRVFPLLVRGDEKTSISLRLHGRQYVDIRSNEEAGLNYVSATLLSYLEELNEQAQSAKKEADRLAAQIIEAEKRLAARKAEEERIALEKINAERKTKEDADRLAAQKAEEERIAFEKVMAERKAKADADRLVAQKTELDSKEKIARENTEREAREKLAREKLERDARENAKREIQVEPIVQKPAVNKPEPKKQSGMKLPLWGIGLIAFMVLALIVWKLSSLPASPNVIPTFVATQTPFVLGTPTLFAEPATETLVLSTSTSQPTETLMPTPALGVGSTEISPKDGMTLLYVPSGEFTMGSDNGALDEKPTHTVTLDAYWIDQTEVTNAQYAKCVADNGACKEPTNKSSYTHSSYYGNSEFDNYPVLYVDWNMANAYCSWAGRELPSEAEWEKAARSTEGNVYPWGNIFDGTSVNFCDVNCSENWANKSFNDGYADVSPVGNYPNGNSIYGGYDMAGNVWEWVNDWYDVYPGGDPAASADFGQINRVLRGGSWSDGDGNVRSAFRLRVVPANTDRIIGFRCARSP